MLNIVAYHIIIFLFSLGNSLLKEEDIPLNVEILLSTPEDLKIGKSGTIAFPGRCQFDNSIIDTSKRTYFTKEILDKNNKSYKAECGPWFDYNFFTYNCYIFCIFNESIPKGNYTITFNDNFSYLNNEVNYNIKIYSNDIFYITKEDYDIIDLYSDIQEIKILDTIEIYELKFKINVFNNERLFYGISKLTPADCKVIKNELICTINKTLLERQIGILNTIRLGALDKAGNIKFFNLIPEILVKYDDVVKNDIYIEITNLLTDYTWIDNYVVYETNVTDIPNIYTISFFLSFEGSYDSSVCSFIKGKNNSLILLCLMLDNYYMPNYLSLPITDEENIYNQSSIIYNFRIQPIKKEMKIIFKNFSYSYIYGIYPEILDFESNELIQIEIFAEQPNKIKGLTFNEEEKDLICEDLSNVKRCIVKETHFKGKDSGYYYLKHDGYNNAKKISYEVAQLEVILSKKDKKNEDKNENDDDDDNNIVLIISIIASVIAIIIVIVIIIFISKKKKSDLENKVMTTSFKYEE